MPCEPFKTSDGYGIICSLALSICVLPGLPLRIDLEWRA